VLVQQLADGIRGRGHAVHLVTYGALCERRPGARAGRIGREPRVVARLWRTGAAEAIDPDTRTTTSGDRESRGGADRPPGGVHGHTRSPRSWPLYFRARW